MSLSTIGEEETLSPGVSEGVLRTRILAWMASQPGGDVAHDQGHLDRVLRMALAIADGEGVYDRPALVAASLLHDCVHVAKNSPQRSHASRLAAEVAGGILPGMGLPIASIRTACHAIEAHSFSAGIEPCSPEARALQDADRIESLGAIGIARCFAVSGSMGRPLFDPQDPLAERRPLDELAWALDHFQTKLLRLPATMRTESGRRMAEQRAGVLRTFMQQIEEECGAVLPG